MRAVRSFVTEMTSETLPSPSDASTTMPEPTLSRSESESVRNAVLSRPLTRRATSFTPATSAASDVDAPPLVPAMAARTLSSLFSL